MAMFLCIPSHFQNTPVHSIAVNDSLLFPLVICVIMHHMNPMNVFMIVALHIHDNFEELIKILMICRNM